jgi:hypothetical protein
MNSGLAHTVGGFAVVVWGLCGAVLGYRDLAVVCAVGGTIFFAAGVIQLGGKPGRAAAWLLNRF